MCMFHCIKIIIMIGDAFNIPAPSVVIYDNACNLHNYCLNREPAFYKMTWMVVDRLHWPNHTGVYINLVYYVLMISNLL